VDGLDDLGAVNPTQIRGGHREVGMTELALDHQQREPLAGHLDGVRVPELVRREPAADARSLGGATELAADPTDAHGRPRVGPRSTQNRGELVAAPIHDRQSGAGADCCSRACCHWDLG
jgi:hypothetical protein